MIYNTEVCSACPRYDLCKEDIVDCTAQGSFENTSRKEGLFQVLGGLRAPYVEAS